MRVAVRKAQNRHPAELPETAEEKELLKVWDAFLSDPSGFPSFWRNEVGFYKALSPRAIQRLIEKVQDLLFDQMMKAANRVGYDGSLRFHVYQQIRSRTGQLVIGIDNEQRQALRRVIAEMLRGGYSMTETQKLVRQTIGLTDKHAQAVRRFYESMRLSGFTQQQAAGKASGYSRRLRRTRAWAIARTESSWAYNFGRLEGWREMSMNGQLPFGGQKEWHISADACQLCVALDGSRRPLNGYFDSMTGLLDAPPAHVNCRCVVDLYYERAEVLGA